VTGVSRSRGASVRCGHEKRKGLPSSLRACTHDRRCATGSRRGFAYRKAREPSLGSVGLRTRARTRVSGCACERGSMLVALRKVGERVNVEREARRLTSRSRIRCFRGWCPCFVALQKSSGSSSGSKKCAVGNVRVESSHGATGVRSEPSRERKSPRA
jgi:hypothetical protein